MKKFIRILISVFMWILLSVFRLAYANDLNDTLLSCEFWINATPDKVQAIIDQGADVNAVAADESENVLFVASYCSLDTANIKVLLDNGVNIDWVNSRGRNVAIETISSGDIAILKFLHENGVDFNVLDKNGCGVFWIATAVTSNVGMVSFLLQVSDMNINDRRCFKSTPLARATRYNQPDIVQEIIELGADVNMRDPGALHQIGIFVGAKPLFYARRREVFKGTKALELLEQKTNETWYDRFLQKYVTLNLGESND